MKTMKNIKQSTGYPSKKFIRHLLDQYISRLDAQYPINEKCVVFSDGYLDEGRGAGILWKATKSMEPLIGLHEYLQEHGVKVKRYKYWGQVHSIWLACQNGQE
jgi:hypothetical protein